MIAAVCIFLLVAGTIGFAFGWGARDALARSDLRDYDRSVLEALRRIGGVQACAPRASNLRREAGSRSALNDTGGSR